MRKLDLAIRQGATFVFQVLWETDVLVYRPIVGISNTAPAVVTSPDHGVPNGWMVAIASVVGLNELNAVGNPPKDEEFRKADVISDSEIAFNKVNAAGFKVYQSGGFVVYYQPADLNLVQSVRMQIRDKIGGNAIHSMTLADDDFAIDFAKKRIVGTIDADAAATFTFKKAVYDLEVETTEGIVVPLFYGAVSLAFESTTIS